MSTNTREEICTSCGKKFIFRGFTSTEKNGNDKDFKPLCPTCLSLKRKQAEREGAEKEKEIYRQKKEAEYKQYTERLKTWKAVPLENVHPNNDKVLYILGNGFDLMHRVPSSYYNFRDSLGKNNNLRYMLENYITVEDCWADLEYALAHIDVSAMSNEYVLDMFLDTNGAYDEDSGAAEYYMSVEDATAPMATIATELPRRFRKWVDTLKIGTSDRPLNNMFRNGKVLCFNYTEFAESLYNISKDNICYIHGCRLKEKGKPREPLILGHMLGASDQSFEVDGSRNGALSGYRRAFTEMAQANVIDYISEYDEELTKDTGKIIKAHEQYFSRLSNIETVIVIGHSYSETDLNYFLKVKSSIGKNARWYFGCYGLHDLDNLEELVGMLGLDRRGVTIFRTDTVVTMPLSVTEKQSTAKRNAVVSLCKSKSGKWNVTKKENDLIINETITNSVDYQVTISGGFKRAFFISDDNFLIVVTYSITPVILVFRKENDHWQFGGELYCDHQHLLVERLRHVFVNEAEITFVYNNRIRKYSLLDGLQICNKKIHGAKDISFIGEDITEKFFRNC